VGGVRGGQLAAAILRRLVAASRSVDNILRGAPGPYSEDRVIPYRDGSTTTQRNMAFSSGMTHADTQQFISYFQPDDPRRMDFFQTGTVDMRGYLEWLNNNGYGLHLAVR
jgi:hypothetical protein